MIENNLKTYVAKIIEKVRKGGDTVLSLYSQRFDGLKLLPCDFRLTGNEKKEAMKKVSDETRT
ncbi:MAG: histidinol dehydrogenase, partial [Elusimicrobiota bacterium]